MKRSIGSILLLVAAAVAPGCQQGTDGSAKPFPGPGAIPTRSFESADSGTRAPIPFPKTGDLYVLETGCDCVLSITPAGKISIALTQQQILDVTGAGSVSLTGSGLAFDAAGTLYFTEAESGSVLKRERGKALTTLASEKALTQVTGQPVADPEGLALDSSGALYTNDNESDSVLKIDPVTGSVSVVVTGKDLGALVGLESADLTPSIAVGRGDVVYTTNNDDPQAIIGIEPPNGVGVLATSRLFESLKGYMTVAKNGNLIIMDADAEIVFRISSGGEVTTYLSEAQLQSPIDGEDGRYRGGIAFDADENLYVTEQHENHILRFDPGFQGSIWVERSAIQTVTRSLPDLDGGIAFAPLLE